MLLHKKLCDSKATATRTRARESRFLAPAPRIIVGASIRAHVRKNKFVAPARRIIVGASSGSRARGDRDELISITDKFYYAHTREGRREKIKRSN